MRTKINQGGGVPMQYRNWSKILMQEAGYGQNA